MAKDITKTMKKNPPLCRRFYCKYPMGKKLFKFNNERRNNGCAEVDSEPSQISKRNFFRENVSKKLHLRSSVIRQKGESQNGCFKKKSTSNFPKNEHFLPLDWHMYVACFVFLEHPSWDWPFCLITDETLDWILNASLL